MLKCVPKFMWNPQDRTYICKETIMTRCVCWGVLRALNMASVFMQRTIIQIHTEGQPYEDTARMLSKNQGRGLGRSHPIITSVLVLHHKVMQPLEPTQSKLFPALALKSSPSSGTEAQVPSLMLLILCRGQSSLNTEE